MSNQFSDAISEIMPLVNAGDKSKPFIITWDSAYGDWQVCYPTGDAKTFLASQREHDPFAVKFVGADFDGGGYAFVYDKVLCARLRAEYNAIPYGELHGGKLNALINAVEDNTGSFSQSTLDYLLARDNPLRELYDLNPIPLWNRDGGNNEPYLEESVAEFIAAVEYKIAELAESQHRHVKKGEHGIKIFAPIATKGKELEVEKLDPVTKQPVLDENGQPVMEKLTPVSDLQMRFKLVTVFSEQQTEGDALPELAETLIGDVERYDLFMDTLRAISPLPIVFEPMDAGQDGYCAFGDKIGIREGMSEIQTVAAVVHEITQKMQNEHLINIGHPSGIIDVEARVDSKIEGGFDVKRAVIGRTARKLMEGYAWF